METLKVFDIPEKVASAAAGYIGELARHCISERGQFSIALSGGTTPWQMLRSLSRQAHDWDRWHVFQVDERVAPADDESRNLLQIRRNLTDQTGAGIRLHAMAVEAPNLDAAADRYSSELQDHCGHPPVLDLVQLGMGADGHTASLVPGDPVLDVVETDVAISAAYQGCRRMTLTFPVINRARHVAWLITGGGKTPALRQMLQQDTSIPAARVSQEHAVVFADKAAAAAITNRS
jgi:6-phosphogluconolactonase